MKAKNSVNTSVLPCVILIMLAFALRIFVYGLYQIPSGSMETTVLVGDVLVGNKWRLWWSAPQRGDIVVFNDPQYDYSDSSVISFFEHHVMGPNNITKRIIAVPGDHLQGKIEDQKPVIYLNGTRLSEPYVNQYPIVLVDEDASSIDLDMKSTGTGDFRSYDPSKSYADQPFYTIDQKMVVHTSDNKPLVRMPNVPVGHDKSHVQSHDEVDYWSGSDIFNITLKDRQYWVMGDSRRNSFDSREFGPIDRSRVRAVICYRLFSIDTSFSWRKLILAPWRFFDYIRWRRCFTFVPSHHTTIKE